MGSRANRKFSKEETQMAKRHLRNYSPSLIIRGLQFKMTLRYHLTLVRMTKIKNIGNSLYWRGCGQGNTSPLLLGVQTCMNS